MLSENDEASVRFLRWVNAQKTRGHAAKLLGVNPATIGKLCRDGARTTKRVAASVLEHTGIQFPLIGQGRQYDR